MHRYADHFHIVACHVLTLLFALLSPIHSCWWQHKYYMHIIILLLLLCAFFHFHVRLLQDLSASQRQQGVYACMYVCITVKNSAVCLWEARSHYLASVPRIPRSFRPSFILYVVYLPLWNTCLTNLIGGVANDLNIFRWILWCKFRVIING